MYQNHNQNHNLKLKMALLSTCLVSASLNAVTGLVPEMAEAFPDVSLSTVELIATVPSLFQMVGVLGGQPVAKKLGYKGTMLLALLFCAAGGVIPVFLPLFPVIFITRCFFGTGCGLLMSSLLTLTVHFFDGRTRSTMIGLNGGISGLGSAFATFVAGMLLVFGWNVSFSVYFLGFAVMALVLLFVPKVDKSEMNTVSVQKTSKAALPVGLWGLGILMFVSVMLATVYVIKASTLITDYRYGTAREGSVSLTLLSLGSFLAGLTYGRIRARLAGQTLTLAFAICAAGCLLGGFAQRSPRGLGRRVSARIRVSHLHAVLAGAGFPELRRFWRDRDQSCACVSERRRVRHAVAGHALLDDLRRSEDPVPDDGGMLRSPHRRRAPAYARQH